MKKTAKLLLVSIATVGVAASISSCGKDEFNGITINFWHTFGQTVLNGFEESAKTFASLVKEHEDVNVRVKFTYKGGYDDVLGEVGRNFSVGGNPTIAVAYPDHVADYFASETTSGEYVVNLEPYANNEEYGFGKESWLGDTAGIEDFVESFIAESTNYAKDGMYSVPLLKSTEVMLYNMDLVAQAMKIIDNLPTLPSNDDVVEFMEDLSWVDFMDFCESVKDHMKEISDKLEIPAVYDSDGNLFITQLFQRNIPYAYAGNTENTGVIGFNASPDNENPTAEQEKAYADVVKMLKEYKGWFDSGYFTTKGVTGEYSSNYFTPGKTMFAIGSCGGSGYSFPSSSEFRVGACKVPYANNNPLYVSQGPTLTVLHNSKLKAAGTDEDTILYAWKFIKYITNAEVNAKQCTVNSEGYIPVRSSAYNTSTFTNFLKSDTDYVVVTKTVVNDIDGRYFSSPVFKGSAELRNNAKVALLML